MDDKELLKRFREVLAKTEDNSVMSVLTKHVSASTADDLVQNRYKYKKPSRRTRKAILEVLSMKAS